MTNNYGAAQGDRKAWMSLMARAPSGRLTELCSEAEFEAQGDFIRAPEVGSVMVRGRMGGTGDAFNLGEMTVTRCAISLADGVAGHGYVQGRDKDDAAWAARMDALMQTSQAARVQRSVLKPLADEEQDRRSRRARKAAATKVEFFTMTRGEDE
ncbi:phosphonate C-P lyase system protein PhnG [Qingshengfaniella alkalisoli]|uniref:Phosphonate C-P lyase system protein PhnG n=1 Tax=Qingshengfaniella alkalisoli TaxID=2599296 RepID=A0A5B8IB87_9RHOB|nr:phosphonate C-P lyase system protein PhnG [Qingshengfaniella alkalisoli]QDY71429.1 phosphonate C-P lyase system protein PhnG [Qingshengfaniella alkalisoli]